jgi:hypothetical protein
MKTKILKTRNRFGVAEYHEFTDLDGVLAIGISLHHSAPNARTQALMDWLQTLGHKPSDSEFEAWIQAQGVQPVEVKSEDYEN